MTFEETLDFIIEFAEKYANDLQSGLDEGLYQDGEEELQKYYI